MLRELFVESSVSGKVRSGIRKQSRNSANSLLWHFMGLPLLLGVTSYVTWNNVVFPGYAIPMAAGCGLAYLATWINQYRSASYLSYRTFGLTVLFLTASLILVLVLLASFRLYYSRMFLLVFYFLSVSWFVGGLLMFQEQARQFLVITGGISNSLRTFPASDRWVFTRNLANRNRYREFDALVIDMHEHDDPALLKQIADASLQGVPVRHAASVYEEYSGRTSLEYLAHEGLFELAQSKLYLPAKRIWESLLIFLTSVLVLPLAAITALAIKLESRGPVFFTQQRVGRNGELFTLYKFRSMRQQPEENGAQFAGEDDGRITRVGSFIRKYRIDELPQFWNVLKGEMSLIGPRPEQPEFVATFNEEIPFYSYRHKVRPGITGWAQNKDGYADDLESTRRKLEYDLYYVKNISLSLDILIVYATIKTILTGFGSR